MEQLSQFIINHWTMCLALVAVLIIIFINELQAQKQRGKSISPQEAVMLINNDEATIIDLRDTESFRAAHIIDAFRASNEDFEQKRMDKYKNKPFILVCARGLQSSTLASKLRKQGFLQPLILAGGMAAWQNADLPVVKGK